jgi:ATP-binding cassette subfamily B protein
MKNSAIYIFDKKRAKLTMKILKEYFSILSLTIKNCKFLFFIIVFVNVIIILIRPFILFIERHIFNTVEIIYKESAVYSSFFLILFVYLFSKALDSLFGIWLNVLMLKIGLKMDKDLNLSINKHCSNISIKYYDNDHFFSKIQEASQGTLKIIAAIPYTFIVFIGGFASFFVLSGYLFTINHFFLFMVFASMVPYLFMMRFKAKFLKRYISDISPLGKETEYYRNCILDKKNLIDLRVHRSVSSIIALWYNSKELLDEIKIRNEYKIELCNSIAGFVDILINILIFAFGIYNLAIKKIDVGSFTILISSIELIKNSLNQIMNNTANLFQCIQASGFYFDFLRHGVDNRVVEKQNSDNGGFSSFNTLKCNDITVKYDNIIALENINLEIQKNSRIAVVGPNGSGKTTLAKTLLGMYAPDKGDIFLDNNNYLNIPLNCLYNTASALFQTFQIYPVSIRENICFGKSIQDSLLLEYLKVIGFNISKYPEKLSTGLGSEFGGIELSGGEAQKIAFARACAKKSDLIILDEPTSAIDPKDESKILEEYYNITNEKTSIIITHRLGFAKNSDLIIVLDKGNIIEMGNHQKLIENGGYYAKLFSQYADLYLSKEGK